MYNPGMESDEDVLHHNLMVNYLPTSCTSDELKTLFEKFGPVKECIVICDPQTGESRGYGFVRFTRRVDAETAMTEMNGYTFDGKRLAVKKADVGKDVDGAASVYVAGFQPRAGMARELRKLFGEYGIVLDVTVMTPQEGKKGVAFVKFARYADAIAAVENVKEYRKQELTVKIASQTARRAYVWQRLAKDYDDTVTVAQHICVPQSERNVLVLYHYPSADGILAALAAHLFLKNYHPELTVRDIAMIPHPVYRPSPAPDKLPINRRMTDVFLLGYAGSPEYVQQLAHECNSVTILDHHTAARELFAALQEARALPPSVDVVVDADRSAATLAWDYFTDKAGGSILGPHGSDAQLQQLCRLFEYSEDHALGRHYLPGSRAFAYALQKENLNFNVLENSGIWARLLDLNIPDLIKKGEEILTQQKVPLDTILDKSFVIQIRDPHDPEHTHFGQCLAVLTDHAANVGETAYRLAVKSAESGLRAIGAVAIQHLGDTTCKVNLRAVNFTDEDCLQIAEAFDSTAPRNHPGASSFVVPLESFQSWVVAQTPAPPMPRNLTYTTGQISVQYHVSRPEVYEAVTLSVTPQYFEVALGTTQNFEAFNAPPLLIQNIKQMGFPQCPRVAAAIYPIHVHRDVLCLLPRHHASEHVYLWMVFNGLLRHLDPTATRLHSLIMCSSIPMAQHVYMVAQAYAKGTGARISCVCEPLAGNSPILDCHILITTPNTAAMLCRESLVHLNFLKTVMIHDADHVLHAYLKHHLVDVLGRIWAVRKRSGVTVGMYSNGSYRLVRQLASDLMEKDADQHVTVIATDPNDPDGMLPAVMATSPVGEGVDVKDLLEQFHKKGDPTGPSSEGQKLLAHLQAGGKSAQFSGQVSSILGMTKQPQPQPSVPVPAPVPPPVAAPIPGPGPSAPLPQGGGFSGNVQTIFNQLPPQGIASLQARGPPFSPPPMPPMMMQTGFAMPPAVPLAQFPPMAMAMPVPPGMMGPISYDMGRPQGFGKGAPIPLPYGGPPPMGMPGYGGPRDAGRGKGFVPTNGVPSRGGKGKGISTGKGTLGPKPVPPPGASDGIPRASGQAAPMYPWAQGN